MRVRRERSVIAFLASLSIMLAFGIDAALPAFDEIRAHFDVVSGDVSLIVTFYFLGMAAGQLFYGLLSDRFGRLPLLLVGVVLYSIGAAGSALAPSFDVLLLFRLVWGFGAAGPNVLSASIARDLYSGDQMARVLSIVFAVFLIGPTLAPLIGDGLLAFGGWKLVFVASLGLALVMAPWAIRFGETLPVEKRRSVQPSAVARAVRTVATNRASAFYIAAMVFSFGAFFVFLGSSQPIIDEIYGRGEWFALIFGAISAINGLGMLVSGRSIKAFGAAATARVAYFGLVLSYAVLALAALATGGVPSFWIWAGLITVTSTLATVITTTCISLALLPMERIAGTAAAVRGIATLGIGSLLAALIDSRIEATITPMAVGGLVYSIIGTGLLLWARGGSLDPVDPDLDVGLQAAP